MSVSIIKGLATYALNISQLLNGVLVPSYRKYKNAIR